MSERGAYMAEVPGASTSLLVRQYQGAMPVYKVDSGLISFIAQLLDHRLRAGIDLILDQRSGDMADIPPAPAASPVKTTCGRKPGPEEFPLN